MTSVSATGSSTAAAQGTQPEAAPKSMISSDFTTFLKMLTAQMQNQDPLNPIDSADYAVQLATFSAVEQQVRTNDLLAELVGRGAGSDLAQMADWVGRTVRAGDEAVYEGVPITVSTPELEAADHAELVVTDALGVEQDRLRITADGGPVDWSGTGANGLELPWGTYSFAVEGFNAAGKSLGREPVEVYSEVIEARTGEAGMTLLLAGGVEVAADAVTAVRDQGY